MATLKTGCSDPAKFAKSQDILTPAVTNKSQNIVPETKSNPQPIRYLTIGSCLGLNIAYQLTRSYKNYERLASVRFNRMDRFVNTYMTRVWAELPWRYIQESPLILKFDSGSFRSQACAMCQIQQQMSSDLLGQSTITGLSSLADSKDWQPLLGQLQQKNHFDVVILDTFFDLLVRLCVPSSSRLIQNLLHPDKIYKLFLQVNEIENYRDFFRLEEDYLEISTLRETYQIFIDYIKQKNPQVKIISIGFPLYHHHREGIRKRVREIDVALSQLEGLFYIPAQHIHPDFLKNPNHFHPIQDRDLNRDYTALVDAIAHGRFDESSWCQYVQATNGKLLDHAHGDLLGQIVIHSAHPPSLGLTQPPTASTLSQPPPSVSLAPSPSPPSPALPPSDSQSAQPLPMNTVPPLPTPDPQGQPPAPTTVALIQDLVDPQVTLSAAAGSQMYRRLGLTALKRRQVKTALRYLRQAQRFDPTYAPIIQELGELLARQGQMSQAIAVLRHAIAVDPDWAWSYYHLAKCYERQGEWERALVAYQRTTELAPNFFWGFQDYGEALAKQGQHRAAVEALQRATQLDPSFSWAYHHLGGSLTALGQYDQAVMAYQQAIERKPDFPWSYYNLGEALAQANRRDEARAAYQTAAKLQPNLPGLADRTIDLLVQTTSATLEQHLKRGSKPASDRDLEDAYAAVQAMPNSVGRWLYLANLLRTQGQKAQALEAYQRVLDLSPTHADARRYYDQLLATPVVDGFPPDLILPPIVGENNDYTCIEQQVQTWVESGQPYTMPVSLIIPTYNRKHALAKTLAALVHQTYPQTLIEVIIADDGSSDGVEEVIRRYEDRLEIVHVRQGDRGYRLSAVRNLGIRTARHEALIIFDCDVLPTPEFVEAYMRYLHVSDRAILIGHRRFVDPSHLGEADILADPNVIVNLPDIRTQNNSWEQAGEAPTIDWRIEVYEETDYLKKEIFPFRAFVGASAAYMRSALVQAGFYDEEFQAWGREDTEMGYRFYNEGFYFIPVMDAVGLHQEPPGGENETDRKGGLSITEQLFVQKCPIPTYYRPYHPGATYRVPKVSIYIPAYNVERFIQAAIDSVLNQTFSDLEVCVVDDGSTDNTLAVIEENYHDNPRVRWQSQPNGGIGKASNAAVRMCRGAYIGQLDADDLLTPDAVETLVNYLDRHNVGCVYGTRELIDAEGKKIGMPYNWPVFSREKLLLTMIVHHFRMFRRRDWMRTEGFAEDLVNAVDYDMFLKLSEVCTLVHLDKIMYSYRMHGTNTSIVDKSAQDRNDLMVLERALARLGLADQWEVYVPNPDQPRKTAFRRKPMG